MKTRYVAIITAVTLGWTVSSSEAQTGDPTFLIDQQVGQATGDTCQSYVLAIALAFKRDPQLPLRSWRDIRDLETRLRTEVVKARDLRLPDVQEKQRLASPDDSAKAVQAVTGGRYTLKSSTNDIAQFGQLVGQRTGVTTEVDLTPSFLIGGLVKDVVVSSAKKIGEKSYNSGHQFAIFGVSGPPNSDRKYLVLNSAAYRKKGEQLFNSCQEGLPDDPGPYFPSLSWRSDIQWNPDGSHVRGMTVEKR